ncbi:hypothetical protein RB195_003001 [Necator americanus]|uniref:Arrestin-like N-terminal domain-containing protein n=1 Tax=Necator americanus TaxID=51031 RepID=A0ABR1DLM0_NECAM
MLRHAKEQVTVRRSRVWATGMVIRPAQPGPSEVIAAPLPFPEVGTCKIGVDYLMTLRQLRSPLKNGLRVEARIAVVEALKPT